MKLRFEVVQIDKQTNGDNSSAVLADEGQKWSANDEKSLEKQKFCILGKEIIDSEKWKGRKSENANEAQVKIIKV